MYIRSDPIEVYKKKAQNNWKYETHVPAFLTHRGL